MAEYFILATDIDGLETGSKLFKKPTEIDQVVEELYSNENCYYVRIYIQDNIGMRRFMLEVTRHEYEGKRRRLRR